VDRLGDDLGLVAGGRRHDPGRPAPDSWRRTAVWIARAAPSFTNRTSPSWFILLRRTVTSMPSPSVASATSAQRSALTSLRRHPGHEQQSRDHRVDPSALEGEHGGQVRGPERQRLSPSQRSGQIALDVVNPGLRYAVRRRPGPALVRRSARVM